MKKKRLKIKDIDKIFSLFIRERDGWKCQVCGKDCSENRGYLDNSHYHSRVLMSVRFDPENCDAFCKGCHMRWENCKTTDYHDWKLAKMGKKGFEALKRRAYRSEYNVIGGFTQVDLAQMIQKYKIT